MAMTDQEQKDIRAYCAFLLKEYGFHFSPTDPIIPALYIMHKEMQLNNHNNQAIALLVKEASTKISPNVFHFDSPGVAFQFQLGEAVKWILVGIPFFMLLWIGLWYWSMTNDVDRARTIIRMSDNVGELLKRARVNEKGYYFIDFTTAGRDSIMHFKEFRKVDSKTVRVYLGKESK